MLKKYCFSIMAVLCFMGVTSSYADTLCPDPQIESSVVPSDLARVQEDIDRLSLCVERTKLLQQLNELVNEPKKSATVQPLSLGALDPAFLEPVTANTLRNGGGGKNSTASMPQSKPFETKADWSIRRVWGKDGVLQAQLISSEGVLSTVKIGDDLSDGSVVEEVSVRGVKVKRKNGQSKELGWQENADESL